MIVTMKTSQMDVKRITQLLNDTYWAGERSEDVVRKSMTHSDCIAVLDGDLLVGFARVVTDYTTVFWLCDVVVSRQHRGQGIGKLMMEYLRDLDYYKGLKGILATKDAFGLYEQYGFVKSDRFMSKDRGHDGHL